MMQLPYSKEAEEALLGALIINPEAIRGTSLKAEHFYLERNRWVYEAISELSIRHDSVDYLTICEELKKAGRLKDIGGEARITELVTSTESSMHSETYGDIIKEKYRRRQVILAAQELTQKAFDETADMDAAVAKAAENIVVASGRGEGAHHISVALSKLYDKIDEAAKNPKDIFGIQTGFTDFDRHTGGLQRGEVFMLSGEPGVGKSFYAWQLGVGCAKAHNGTPGTAGVLYELEMSEVAVMRRGLSVESKVSARDMRTGHIRDDDWPVLTSAVEIMADLPIYISDRTDWTTLDIRSDIARLKTHGIGWVIIDYMALLKDEPGMDETEKSGILSDRIHDIAKDLDVAVIAIHDMTKGAQTGQIKGQAGLSGHRRVGYNADMSAFLLKTQDENMFKLEWAKFREDIPNRYIDLRRVDGFPAYAEVTKSNLPKLKG